MTESLSRFPEIKYIIRRHSVSDLIFFLHHWCESMSPSPTDQIRHWRESVSPSPTNQIRHWCESMSPSSTDQTWHCCGSLFSSSRHQTVSHKTKAYYIVLPFLPSLHPLYRTRARHIVCVAFSFATTAFVSYNRKAYCLCCLFIRY